MFNRIFNSLRRLVLRAWYRLFPIPDTLPRGEQVVIYAYRVISLLGDDMNDLELALLAKVAEIKAAGEVKNEALVELALAQDAEGIAEDAVEVAEAAVTVAAGVTNEKNNAYLAADEVFDGKLAELIALADAAKV